MMISILLLLFLIIIVLTLPTRCFVPMNLSIQELFLFKTFLHFLTDQRLAFSTSMAAGSFRAGKPTRIPVDSSDSLLVGW